jgi:hypothetical protein
VRVVTYEDRRWLATIIVDTTTTPTTSVAIAGRAVDEVLVTVLTMVATIVVAIFTVIRALYIVTIVVP